MYKRNFFFYRNIDYNTGAGVGKKYLVEETIRIIYFKLTVLVTFFIRLEFEFL